MRFDSESLHLINIFYDGNHSSLQIHNLIIRPTYKVFHDCVGDHIYLMHRDCYSAQHLPHLLMVAKCCTITSCRTNSIPIFLCAIPLVFTLTMPRSISYLEKIIMCTYFLELLMVVKIATNNSPSNSDYQKTSICRLIVNENRNEGL